jgi:chorismate dehydratase
LDRKIRIGAVSYLNTKPLLFGLQHESIREQLEIILDYPAHIANMLEDGTIDVGLVPVAILPRLKEYHIVSDYCIGCNGSVDSVAIFSELPLEQVSSVILDYQSKTSVMLARILMKNYWKQEILFIDAEGEDFLQDIRNDVAGLVIGDRALRQKKKSRFMYDLGRAWKDYTGLPFVFAAWVSNKQLPPDFISLFNTANGNGIEEIDKVIALEKNPPADLKTYYTQNISYAFNEEKKQGLALFLSMLEEVSTKGGLPLKINTPG